MASFDEKILKVFLRYCGTSRKTLKPNCQSLGCHHPHWILDYVKPLKVRIIIWSLHAFTSAVQRVSCAKNLEVTSQQPHLEIKHITHRKKAHQHLKEAEEIGAEHFHPHYLLHMCCGEHAS